MKIKKLVSFLLSAVLVSMLVCTASAEQASARYGGGGKVGGVISKSSGNYSVSASSSDAISIAVSGTLYEKGWFGYSNVGSCGNSTNGNSCVASSSYGFDGNKSYKLDYSATFHYPDGTNETIPGSIST